MINLPADDYQFKAPFTIGRMAITIFGGYRIFYIIDANKMHIACVFGDQHITDDKEPDPIATRLLAHLNKELEATITLEQLGWEYKNGKWWMKE